MKAILIGLVSFTLILTGSTATADVLGGEDDTYIGFQVTMPLGAKRAGLFSGKNSYSAMLISQTDGIREGIAFNQDINGMQTIGYVRPTQSYRIGQGRISDYTIPILRLDEGAGMRNDFSSGGELLISLVVGIAVVVKVLDYTVDEIVNCTDPDTDSEAIAGC